jgi:hypothetical protein
MVTNQTLSLYQLVDLVFPDLVNDTKKIPPILKDKILLSVLCMQIRT